MVVLFATIKSGLPVVCLTAGTAPEGSVMSARSPRNVIVAKREQTSVAAHWRERTDRTRIPCRDGAKRSIQRDLT